MLESDIGEILLTEKQIHERVAQLAQQIANDYEESPLLILGVLTGAVVFVADLIRLIPIPLRLEFIRAASYGSGTVSSGKVTVTLPSDIDWQSYRILVVEDIVDTGRTIQALLHYLQDLQPLDIRVCTLLDKPSRREVKLSLDYVGFEIPDCFVVGYGLDYNHRYRQLPFVARLQSGTERFPGTQSET